MPGVAGGAAARTGVTSGRLAPICRPGGIRWSACGAAAGLSFDASRRSRLCITAPPPPDIMLIIWAPVMPAPMPLWVATSIQ